MSALGSLVVKLALEYAEYSKGLDKSSQDAMRFAQGIQREFDKAQRATSEFFVGVAKGAAGAALAYASASYWLDKMRTSIDAADHLNDLSKSTGLAVEQLAGLSLAAEQSGSDLDGLAESLNKLSVNMGKAPEKFAALGITAKDPLEAFKQLSDIFVQLKDPQDRAALGAEALGKKWQSAAPLLAEGGQRIGEMVEKGTRLSQVTEDITGNADQLNDQLAEMRAISTGLTTKMAGEMLPAFVEITGAVKQAYEESGKLAALWTAMGAAGAFLFTDQFASAQVKIKNLDQDIAALERKLAHRKSERNQGGLLSLWLFGEAGDKELTDQITGKKQQLEELRKSLEPKAKTPGAATDPSVKGRVDTFVRGTPAAAGAGAASDFDKILSGIREKIALDELQLQLGRQLTDSEKALAKIQSDRASGTIKLTDAEMKALEIEVQKQSKLDASVNLQRELTKGMLDLYDARAKEIAGAIDAAERAEAEVENYGKLASEITLSTIARLEARKAILIASDATWDEVAAVEALIDANNRLYKAQGEKERLDGLAKAKESVDEFSEFTKQAARNMQDAMAGGFFDIMEGKFDSLGNRFGQVVKKMVADWAAAKFNNALFGADFGKTGQLGGLLGGGIGGLGGLFDNMGYVEGLSYKGIGGGFAKGGAFTNGVVEEPTAFNMSQMGEAGPEAIMPLTRRPDGSLGVRAVGAGGGSGAGAGGKTITIAPVYEVTVHSEVDRASSERAMRNIVAEGNAKLVDDLSRAGMLG